MLRRLGVSLEGLEPTLSSWRGKVRLHEATSRLRDPISRSHWGLSEVTMAPIWVPRRCLAPFWVHLEVILSSFWWLWGRTWIFENVCFSIVKPCFLRSGRVLDRVFFVLCFWINTFGIPFVVFWIFVGPQGPHGGQNGSLWGTLRDQISAQLATLVAPWFQGGSRAPKRSHFWSLWGVFWEHFGFVFS